MFSNIDTENATINKIFVCSCGKKYKHRQSLFVHKKNCKLCLDKNTEKPDLNIDITKNNNLIQYLMKDNLEFKNIIMELVKNDNTNLT
jgi:hypothetical protein